MHASEGGVEWACAGVLEGFAGKDVWLLADDAGAVYFGYDAFGVCDFPVAADEPNGLVCEVCDFDLIEEVPHALLWGGVLLGVVGNGVDFDVICDRFCHGDLTIPDDRDYRM